MSRAYVAASTAYRVIFRTVTPPMQSDLAKLTASDLKRAYRKRALECHPDRAHSTGRSADAMKEEFSAVSGAYETLQAYVSSNAPIDLAQIRRSAPKDLWSGQMPARHLRLGEFLFFSGQIGRRSLDAALAWQQRERPMFGAIAQEWGILSQAEVDALLRRRDGGERIAQAAVRLGFVSRTQAEAILTLQSRRQRPLGVYLVAIGALRYDQLTTALERHCEHNARILNAA